MQDETMIEGELTVEDILEEANQAEYHTLLEIWREVLKPAFAEAEKHVTPQWANRIVNTYREIRFADMIAFRDHYFDGIITLLTILEDEIATDDECLKLTSAEEDVEHNSHHYLNILFTWQKQFLSWELQWDCTDELAPVQLAAISEVHKMFFDPQGLTALLDQINFQFTDADRDQLAEELAELAQGGGGE